MNNNFIFHKSIYLCMNNNDFIVQKKIELLIQLKIQFESRLVLVNFFQ